MKYWKWTVRPHYFPGLDGLPLPPPPALAVKVLNSWKKKTAFTQGRQNQGDPQSRPDRHEMVMDVKTNIDDPVNTSQQILSRKSTTYIATKTNNVTVIDITVNDIPFFR